MTERIDLEPVGNALLTIVAAVEDTHLDLPTPYRDHTVGEMLQHLVTVTRTLRDTAEKERTPRTEEKVHGEDWPPLEAGWRAALEEQVPMLVRAWSDESAWEGTTRGGALDLRGQDAGRITLDELVLHSWDVARATGQDYPVHSIDEQIYAESREFLRAVEEEEAADPVEVDDNASIFDRMIALSGRDPNWTRS
ncbi:TIGR03086 family metal-binding protein [Aeromicrobium sp.]|uniref:TIGR03086 family metal-binding protein n=1 Tax=Aeromicrobium sp. TaxID=1871063 RepID=UPI0028AC247B|nr:TIGR03086 family metal-binding protein [Aeromicrobium sp.]